MTAASAGATRAPYPLGRAWYGVIVLMLLYCMSFIDRLVLSLLASPISEALGVSDTQIGLLFGMGFGVVYALSGLPLAHLIDKHHRVRIITVGVIIWSVCTIASGFAPDYTALLLLRAGVAVGEAVLSPAAVSILADMFPRQKRTLPTSVYTSVGTFMGAGAFVAGGAALDVATWLSPMVGHMPPWQLTLVLVGIPGLLLGPLLLATVPEPVRAAEPVTQDFASAKQAVNFVIKELNLYGFIFVGLACYSTASFAKTAWVPTYLVRGYGLSPSEAGYIYGTVGLIAGILGAASWPALVRYWTSRGRKDAMITLFTLAFLVGTISLAVIGLTRSMPVLYIAAAANFFFGSAGALLPPLIIQYVAPSRMRARLMAINLMASNLVGLTVGPPLAAYVAETFFDGRYALGSGVAAVCLALAPIGTVSIFLARKRYLSALDEAAAREAAAPA